MAWCLNDTRTLFPWLSLPRPYVRRSGNDCKQNIICFMRFMHQPRYLIPMGIIPMPIRSATRWSNSQSWIMVTRKWNVAGFMACLRQPALYIWFFFKLAPILHVTSRSHKPTDKWYLYGQRTKVDVCISILRLMMDQHNYIFKVDLSSAMCEGWLKYVIKVYR